jgi:hypothetical protein
MIMIIPRELHRHRHRGYAVTNNRRRQIDVVSIRLKVLQVGERSRVKIACGAIRLRGRLTWQDDPVIGLQGRWSLPKTRTRPPTKH